MRKHKILVGVVLYNEEEKIVLLLNKMKTALATSQFFVVFVNDHSTDSSLSLIESFVNSHKNTFLINNKKNSGVGKSIKKIIEYGLNNKFDVCVIMAGNGKDDPGQIYKLTTPIIEKGYDYVQGSRFLKGGSFNNLPLPRKLMIKGFTLLFSFFTGFSGTDASNGFRAYRLSLFADKRINYHQAWLDRYEFETYLHYKVITLGYRLCEVAVSKNYLHGIKNYSKMRPVIDWWKMMRPLLFLKLGLKK